MKEVFPYTLKVSKKMRYMKLVVNYDGQVILTVPHNASYSRVEDFITKRKEWVEEKLNYFKKFEGKILCDKGERDYTENKAKALKLAEERINFFNNTFYKYPFRKINVRNQVSRWGSCSRSGNLSFNYKIIYLPPALADYLIVHELCHLDEFNHSGNFWALVERALPHYRELRRELKTYLI